MVRTENLSAPLGTDKMETHWLAFKQITCQCLNIRVHEASLACPREEHYNMNIETFYTGLVVGMSALCVSALATRREHRTTYLPLAGFFFLNGLTAISFVVQDIPVSESLKLIKHFTVALSLPATLTLPILFWFYIRGLTSETAHSYGRRDIWHFAPVILGFIGMGLVLSLPLSTRDQIFGSDWNPVTVREYIAVVPVVLLSVFSSFQIAFYLFLALRRLIHYRARLKDIFASTDNRELGWIFGLFIFLGLYWAILFAYLIGGVFFDAPESSIFLDGILETGLTFIIGTWGLRQIPGFAGAYTDETEALSEISKPPKYENSGLTPDDMARIAAKIERAMTTDRIYQNPNLSLRDLAKHIRVSPNYVSQTLNAHIGETFFDYINRARIGDALEMIKTSDASILEIAYGANFNSRSSFYKAFKRETGITPKAYRAGLST